MHCTHLLSLLVDWEVAGLDAQHPPTTETQHVLGGKEKCTIMYLRGRKVVMVESQHGALFSHLTVGVPGHTVCIGLLKEQLFGEKVKHQQCVVLVHYGQLCPTACVWRNIQTIIFLVKLHVASNMGNTQ